MRSSDVAIAGAGLIGAALALELASRGLTVALLSAGEPLRQASSAAAGMLAVDDPENPPVLHPLAALSRALYPAFLARLAALTATSPPVFQTSQTLQAVGGLHDTPGPRLTSESLRQILPQLTAGEREFVLLDEVSLDPRELAASVRLALAASSKIRLHHEASVEQVEDQGIGVRVQTAGGVFEAAHFVDCTGAWTLDSPRLPRLSVSPRKGQLLTVVLPPSLSLQVVVRTPEIYIVPRLHGAQTGHAVLGATVEDCGFNTEVEPAALAMLRTRAADLLPVLAEARIAKTWAGLRPATVDGLPILDRTGQHTWVSKGHFRNGILLAPASACVVAQLIVGEATSVDLAPFSVDRLAVS